MFLFRLFRRTILTNYHPKLQPEDIKIIDIVIDEWYKQNPIDLDLAEDTSLFVDPENIFKYLLMPTSCDNGKLHQKCAALAYDDNIIIVSFLSCQTISVYKISDLTGYSNLDAKHIEQSIIIQ